MEEVRKVLEERKIQLMQLKKMKEKALQNVPKGALRICCNGNRTQYYHRKERKDRRGVYLPEKEKDLAGILAQKEYDQKVLHAVEKELRVIEKCLAGYPVTDAEVIYEKLHEERKKLVLPIRESEEQFVRNWEAVVYQGKGFEENAPEFYTAKNERVRSKSEWIIADFLKREGIPYRYEYPMYLNGMGQVYPDFTVLNVKSRKELYWEHLGMMDDVAYMERALQKIAAYEQNGIYLGESLILTYETGKSPLSQKLVMNKIEHYLK